MAEVLAITASALKYENLSALIDILREIGQATDSFAVLLWELAQGVDPNSESRSGQLFVLADWIKTGERYASHMLSLDSLTGEAILKQSTQSCTQVTRDQRVFHGPPDFFGRYSVSSFVSIPVRLGDSACGALSLYRNAPRPISSQELAVAEAFALVFPGIYEGLREKSGFRLLAQLSGIIHKHEGRDDSLQLKTATEALQDMARVISEGFGCLETSIFLIESDVEPNKAKLKASTFPEYVRQREYPIGAAGLTGWILEHRAPIRIFDLTCFDRDRQMIETLYPGVTGFKQNRLVELAKAALKIAPDEPLQPLSFMGVPILVGGDLLGVIRCCAPMRAPYYFNERDVKLLSIAASQVGHYWKNWIQLGAVKNESRSWLSLVDSLRSLIRGVLSEAEPDEPAKLRQFLTVAHEMIPGAEILDVRLHDPDRGDLYFAATEGKAWMEGDPRLSSKWQETRFPLSQNSVGTAVFKKNQTISVPDVSRDSVYSEMFPAATSMIVAPISSAGERYGVLDIRITKGTGITPNAPTIAELLGQQLGLYLHLSRTLQKVGAVEKRLKQNLTRLEQAEAEREKVLEIQTRVFEDLEHQLKLPVLQARARLSNLLAKTLPSNKVISNVQAIRGLLTKSERVVRGMAMFVALAKEQKLNPRLTRLYKRPLIKLLIEICADCIFLEGHTSRGLRVRVNEESFDVLDTTEVRCDTELLEQAIYDIANNACKYSFANEAIVVWGGLNAAGKFYVAVVNRGIELREEDIPYVTQRGWRGREALMATGQGSGIGCWFAEQVMRAHGGQLKLFPTTRERLTEVRLQF